MIDRLGIPSTRIRDVEMGFCLGKGSTEKMDLFGVYVFNCSSRNVR